MYLDVDIFVLKLFRSTALELVIRLDEEVEKKYFTVAELGCILKHLRDLIIGKCGYCLH